MSSTQSYSGEQNIHWISFQQNDFAVVCVLFFVVVIVVVVVCRRIQQQFAVWEFWVNLRRHFCVACIMAITLWHSVSSTSSFTCNNLFWWCRISFFFSLGGSSLFSVDIKLRIDFLLFSLSVFSTPSVNALRTELKLQPKWTYWDLRHPYTYTCHLRDPYAFLSFFFSLSANNILFL